MVLDFHYIYIFIHLLATVRKNISKAEARKAMLFIALFMTYVPLLHPILIYHLASPFLVLLSTHYTVPTLTAVYTVHPRLGQAYEGVHGSICF